MKSVDLPLWRQMFSPTGSNDELTELKAALSHSSACSEALEKFLFAQWLTLTTLARCEKDKDLAHTYQQSANALAETAGQIFSPTQKQITKSPLRL